MKRKMNQVVVAQFEQQTSEMGTKLLDYHIFGLGNDGSFWRFNFTENKWIKLPPLPATVKQP